MLHAVDPAESKPTDRVGVNVQALVSEGSLGLQAGVVLDSGLDPAVVEVLGRLIQDQLEGHPLALVAALDLHKAAGAPLGFPEALALLAHIAAPSSR